MTTQSIISKSPSVSESLIRQAAEHLQQGQLVCLPTETVYAVAALLSRPPAVSQLKQIKKISGPPNWVIHLPDIASLKKIVAHPPGMALRVMKKLWPGPLAIEVPVSDADSRKLAAMIGPQTAAECIANGFITFRCPHSTASLLVLNALGEPAVMIGAGDTSAVHEAADIPEAIRNASAMVLDTGPTRYRKPSTLIRIQGDQLTFLREGILARRIIERMTDHVILFICSGNTCRSPMAAGIAALRIGGKLGIPVNELPLRRIVVDSAGLYANTGSPPAPEAVQAAADLGADISRHRSHTVTVDMLRRADLIFTMTSGHRTDVISLLPEAAVKTFNLDPDADIADPIGAGQKQYNAVARRMNELIKGRLAEIMS